MKNNFEEVIKEYQDNQKHKAQNIIKILRPKYKDLSKKEKMSKSIEILRKIHGFEEDFDFGSCLYFTGGNVKRALATYPKIILEIFPFKSDKAFYNVYKGIKFKELYNWIEEEKIIPVIGYPDQYTKLSSQIEKILTYKPKMYAYYSRAFYDVIGEKADEFEVYRDFGIEKMKKIGASKYFELREPYQTGEHINDTDMERSMGTRYAGICCIFGKEFVEREIFGTIGKKLGDLNALRIVLALHLILDHGINHGFWSDNGLGVKGPWNFKIFKASNALTAWYRILLKEMELCLENKIKYPFISKLTKKEVDELLKIGVQQKFVNFKKKYSGLILANKTQEEIQQLYSYELNEIKKMIADIIPTQRVLDIHLNFSLLPKVAIIPITYGFFYSISEDQLDVNKLLTIISSGYIAGLNYELISKIIGPLIKEIWKIVPRIKCSLWY